MSDKFPEKFSAMINFPFNTSFIYSGYFERYFELFFLGGDGCCFGFCTCVYFCIWVLFVLFCTSQYLTRFFCTSHYQAKHTKQSRSWLEEGSWKTWYTLFLQHTNNTHACWPWMSSNCRGKIVTIRCGTRKLFKPIWSM